MVVLSVPAFTWSAVRALFQMRTSRTVPTRRVEPSLSTLLSPTLLELRVTSGLLIDMLELLPTAVPLM